MKYHDLSLYYLDCKQLFSDGLTLDLPICPCPSVLKGGRGSLIILLCTPRPIFLFYSIIQEEEAQRGSKYLRIDA